MAIVSGEQIPSPRRAGERWSDTENAQLVELLAAGVVLEDIATELRRGLDAVSSHCAELLDPGERVPRGQAHLVLRHKLAADPDYDWRTGLRARHARRGSFYWDPDADEVLRQRLGRLAALRAGVRRDRRLGDRGRQTAGGSGLGR